MKLADKLLSMRKARGISQEELADGLNVSRQAVSKWEGDQAVPEPEKIVAISDYFGVTTDYLLRDSSSSQNAAATQVQAVDVKTQDNGRYAVTLRRTIIGIALLVVGVVTTAAIIAAGAQFASTMTSWLTDCPSKLMFAIFYTKSSIPGENLHGLGLGVFFVAGIACVLLGLGILLVKYFHKEEKGNADEAKQNTIS